MKRITPKYSTRYFNICFNTTDRERIISRYEVKRMVTKEDLPGRWTFTTQNGYFVFEEIGGAFKVFSPVECKDNAPAMDWMRDDFKEYNGILNIGDPDTKAIFHPNEYYFGFSDNTDNNDISEEHLPNTNNNKNTNL